MEFTDKVKDVSKKVGEVAEKTYKTVADKSNQMMKNAKIRMQVSDIEEEIAMMYNDFGRRIYQAYEKGEIFEGFEKECKKISKLLKDIEELETQGLNIKNLRKCINCGEIINADSRFCPTCGEKQKRLKVEKEAEEVVKACSDCGLTFGPEVNFCTKCGSKLK